MSVQSELTDLSLLTVAETINEPTSYNESLSSQDLRTDPFVLRDERTHAEFISSGKGRPQNVIK